MDILSESDIAYINMVEVILSDLSRQEKRNEIDNQCNDYDLTDIGIIDLLLKLNSDILDQSLFEDYFIMSIQKLTEASDVYDLISNKKNQRHITQRVLSAAFENHPDLAYYMNSNSFIINGQSYYMDREPLLPQLSEMLLRNLIIENPKIVNTFTTKIWNLQFMHELIPLIIIFGYIGDIPNYFITPRYYGLYERLHPLKCMNSKKMQARYLHFKK